MQVWIGRVWFYLSVIGMLGLGIFSPLEAQTYQWSETEEMRVPRRDHSSTLLLDGRILVAGGRNNSVLNSAEIYDPETGTWHFTSSMAESRSLHSATLLPDGKVLVVGGFSSAVTPLATAEIYDPLLGTWSEGGHLLTARAEHTATLLPSGEVLIAGGRAPSILDSCELYDPEARQWRTTDSFKAGARTAFTATLTPSGHVLAIGGWNESGLRSIERYDTEDETWMELDDMPFTRFSHAAVLMPDERILLAGGEIGGENQYLVEVYDPLTEVLHPADDLPHVRVPASAVLFPSGRVAMLGGDPSRVDVFDRTEGWISYELPEPRTDHSATLLPSGNMLIAGGSNSENGTLPSALILSENTAYWENTNPQPFRARNYHTATVLPNQKILVAGGCEQLEEDRRRNCIQKLSDVEFYDPATGTWELVNNAVLPARFGHTATLLQSGNVLIAAGRSDLGERIDAVLYDPEEDTWSTAGSTTERFLATATLLSSGKVLVVGGYQAGMALSTSEIYDPEGAEGRQWTAAAPLHEARADHAAVLLQDGRVLVVGGHDFDMTLRTAEIFDPETGSWTETNPTSVNFNRHAATLLPSGKVLVVGGNGDGDLQRAELFDPATGQWERTGPETRNLQDHQMVLLSSGKVLVTGGFVGEDIALTETFDPSTNTWSPGPMMQVGRASHSSTLLPSGEVLVVGGGTDLPLASSELFMPASLENRQRPLIDSSPDSIEFGSLFTVTGSFRGDSEASQGATRNSAVNYPIFQLRRVDGTEIHTIAPDSRSGGDGEDWNAPVTYSFSRLPTGLNAGGHYLTATVAGVPSEPVPVEVTCSENLIESVEMDPSEPVALGNPVTFTAKTQGVRRFQWFRDDSPIPGATEASYTTPEATTADDGSEYHLVVWSGCANDTSESMLLKVDDPVFPTVNVTAPLGGETWSLSTSERESTVNISWTMFDNIRICRAQIELLYSTDNGSTYLVASESPETDPSEDLPRILGRSVEEDIYCSSDEQIASNITYTLPSTFPSRSSAPNDPVEEVDTLYKIRVTVTDQGNNATYAESLRPFFIVDPDRDYQTLILRYRSRMQQQMGLSDPTPTPLDTALEDLARHPRVDGLIVDLGTVPAIEALYQRWDAVEDDDNPPDNINQESVARANQVLFGCPPTDIDCLAVSNGHGGIHQKVLELEEIYPIKYLVLVGDDRIIPMARLRDFATLWSESRYAPEELTEGTAVGKALASDHYLSDDPLATVAATTPDDLNTGASIPDLAVGRLVERPHEIIKTIQTFQGRNGVLNLADPAIEHKFQTTGYDFLQDSADSISKIWVNALSHLSLIPSRFVDHLIGPDWSEQELIDHLCGNGDGDGGPPFGVINLNGHATHYEEGIPGPTYFDVRGILSGAIGPSAEGEDPPNFCGDGELDLRGSVVYSVGCHGGLPVAGSATDQPGPTTDYSLDLPQTFLGRGAVVYIANSGFGWGMTHGVGYSEKLLEIFSKALTETSTEDPDAPRTVGEAVVEAKLRYSLETYLDSYDEKTLMQWTVFGLPMYFVRLVEGTEPGSLSSDEPLEPIEILPEETLSSGVHVQRHVTHAEDGFNSLNPPYITVVELGFDFSAEEGIYQKFDAERNELDLTEPCPDDTVGCYYTLNGNDATGMVDVPIEPLLIYDSRLIGTSLHGTLWLGGTYTEEPNWKPLFGTLISNGAETGGLQATPRKIRILPIASHLDRGIHADACRTSGNEFSRLAFPVGEVVCTEGDCDLGATHRRYTTIRVDNLYFNNTSSNDETTSNCDRWGPKITSRLPDGAYHRVTGTNVEWVVDVVDQEIGSDIWKVVVVYDTNQGSWEPFELTRFGQETWRGSLAFPPNADLTYVLQAVDTRGNVSWLEWVEPENNNGFAQKNQQDSGVPPYLADTVDVTIELQDVDLSLNISADQDPVTLGTGFNFDIDVLNSSSTEPATDLKLRLSASSSLTPNSLSGAGWTCTVSSLECTRPLLNAGAHAPSIILGVTAPDTPGHWALEATLTADQIPDSEAIVVLRPILGRAETDVEVSLSGPDSTHPSETAQYNLRVRNHGRDAITNLQLDVHMSPRLEHLMLDGQPWGSAPLTLHLAAMEERDFTISGSIAANTPAESIVHSVQAELPDPVLYEDPNLSNNQSSKTTQVLPRGDLIATLVTPPSTMEPGEIETFQVSVFNAGPDTMQGFHLSVHPSTGLENITLGESWTNQDLASGLMLTRSFTGSIPQNAPPGALSVRVDVHPAEGHLDAHEHNNWDETTITVAPSIDLLVDLFGDPQTSVPPEGPVEVAVTVTNNGPHDVQGLDLTYTAGAWLENAQQEGGDWVNQSLAAGANFTRTLSGIMAADEPVDRVDITFQVSADSGYDEENLDNNLLTVSFAPQADLRIVFVDPPSPLQPNTLVTYTVRLTNDGPAAVEDFGVQYMTPVWLLNIDEGETPWDDLPPLEAGHDLELTLEGTVASDTPPGEVDLSVYVNAPEGTSDPVEDNNMALAVVTILPQVAVSLNLFEGPETLVPGQEACFTLGVTNGGPNLVPGVDVILESNLGGFLENVLLGFSFPDGNDPEPQPVCDTVPTGASSQTVLIMAQIVVPDGYQDTTGNHSATIGSPVVPAVDLKIELEETTQHVHPGDAVSFTLKVTNIGTQPVNGFDIALEPPSWLEDPQQGGGPWTHLSLQDGGAFLQRTLSGTVLPGTPAGQVDLTVLIAPLMGYSDENTSNNTNTLPLNVVPQSDLSITIDNEGDVFDAGTTLTYNVTVSNNGSEDMHHINILRTLPDTLVDVQTGEAPWTDLTLTPGPGLTRTLTATLAEGSSGLFDVNVELVVPLGYEDTNLNNNTAGDENLAEVGPPSLEITVTSETPSVSWPGGDVDFTVEVTNTSDTHDPVELTSLMEGDRNLDGEGTCDPPATIAPGANYTCTFTSHVAGEADTTQTVTVTAVGQDDEDTWTTPVDGSAVVAIEQVTVDLEVTKTDNRDQLSPGDPVLYTITIKNLDMEQAVTGITLIDTPPPELEIAEEAVLIWSGIALGTEESTNTAVFYLSGTVKADAYGELLNTVHIELPEGVVDSNPNNNTDTDSTTLEDTLGPQLVSVSTVSDTGDGRLDADEVTQATITQLHLHFNEALDATTAAEVGSYRLIKAGADGVLQTEGCSTLEGDDMAYTIDNAQSLAEETVALWIHGGVALPQGLYRLWACDTVTDTLGNFIAETSLDFSVTAQHRLQASNFDDASTLDHWILQVEPPDAVVFSPDDVHDAATSGSALMSGGAADISLQQCVHLNWSNTLEIGGWIHVEAPGADQPTLLAELELFPQADCNDSPIGEMSEHTLHIGSTEGLWVDLPTQRITLPQSIGSVLITLRAQSESQDFDVWLDDLYLKLVPLHGDGFESGDTSMWSNTVP